MDPDSQHVLDADMSGIFDDPSFQNLQYDSYISSDSPFDTNRLFDLGAATTDSPNFGVRADSKIPYDADPAIQNQPFNTRSQLSSRSAESSSQDSSSETSSRRKRKTTSESPPTDTAALSSIEGRAIKMENSSGLQNFGRSMNNLSLDRDFANGNAVMNTHFDFESAASSPGGMDGTEAVYNKRTSQQMTYPRARNEPPVGTIEPAHFFFNSNTASPASMKASRAGVEASPGALFTNATPSDSADLYGSNQLWPNTSQNPTWTNDYANQYTSPAGLGLTPSPVLNNAAQYSRMAPVQEDRIPLSIGPIPTKSRVETQINIRMTLDHLPAGVKQLHLPTHTIAKAKLLAKDILGSEDTLELHTMLVCTSAMAQIHLRERALQRAAAQDNAEIQVRGRAGLLKKEDDEVEEDDKPANGGEVRICTNCINRERKRAARKKLKKEEEQAHWEKYETERVIVFNTNEYKPWQDWQQSPTPKDNSVSATDLSPPSSDQAMQVIAPMRIACYCRHQNEKDGFQVIFTIKDHRGKVVAQQMSDSILITDDHKTHPLATMPGQVWYNDGGQFGTPGAFTSQSMVDLHSHMPSMSMSKSTGNLQGMSFGDQFHQPSNVHPLSGFASQTTSATMTPRNLSRPASPTGFAGQSGPSKKRKSSSAHRKVPSGLAMTRVDTSQAMSLNAQPAVASPFSPIGGPTMGGDQSYITLPHSGSRAQYHTNPSTPSEGTAAYPFGALSRTTSMDNTNYQAFYSAPSSAHQSRAASPVLMGPNIAAYQRQQAHGGGNGMPIRTNPFGVSNSSMKATPAEPERSTPIINKVTPAEGPTSGGIEVSIYGSGFTPGMEIMFGDRIATATTYWGEKALCCVLPPGNVGPVSVAIAPSQLRQYATPPPVSHAQVFRYTSEQSDMRMMEMALRYYSQKATGNPDRWQSLAQEAANVWLQGGATMQQQQFQGQGQGGLGHGMSVGSKFSDFGTDIRRAMPTSLGVR